MIEIIDFHYGLAGWRKLNYLRKGMKKVYRIAAQIHQKKGKNYQERIEKSVTKYLEKSRYVEIKIRESLPQLIKLSLGDPIIESLLIDLLFYHKMLVKRKHPTNPILPRSKSRITFASHQKQKA